MTQDLFVWDEGKNRTNQQKHGVSFEEAATAFYDERALELYDPDHSQQEDRFLLFGLSERSRLLAISHCYRGEEIRIITARKADNKELRYYEDRI